MGRLTKRMIYQMMYKEASISSPTLDKHFKHVFVGVEMKDRIEKAKGRMTKWLTGITEF